MTIRILGAVATFESLPEAGSVGDMWAITSTTQFAGWPDWADHWIIGEWDDGVTDLVGIACSDVPTTASPPIVIALAE